MFRTNIMMSEGLGDWYTKQAEKMGTNRNAVFVMVLKVWMDNQMAFEARGDMMKMLEGLTGMIKDAGIEMPKTQMEMIGQIKDMEKEIKTTLIKHEKDLKKGVKK